MRYILFLLFLYAVIHSTPSRARMVGNTYVATVVIPDTPHIKLTGTRVMREKESGRITVTGGDASTSYKWEQIEGDYKIGVENIISTVNTVPLIGIIPGNYTIKVTVSHKEWSQPRVFYHYLLVEPQSLPVIKLFESSKTIQFPLNHVKFYSKGLDEDGWVTSYKWRKEEGPSCVLEGDTTPILSVSSLTPGNYRFVLVVKDKQGQESLPAFVSLIVNGKLQPLPVVTISESFKTIQLPTTEVKFYSSASSKEGKVKSYQWRKENGPPCVLEDDTTSILSISSLTPGNYHFTLVVKDDQGQESLSASAALIVNPEPRKNISPFPPRGRLKGGPGNAIINLILPGLGHYYVSGYNGEDRKSLGFFITAGYMASLGTAVYFKLKSNTDYKKYTELANAREYQRDASGNIIGTRGGSESAANVFYNNADAANKNFQTLLMVSGGILATDFIYTLIKGISNAARYHRESRVSLRYNPVLNQFGTVFTLNQKHKRE